MREENFRDKRFYRGNLSLLFTKVCEDYDLGAFISSKWIEMGYEDFNHIIETTQGKYFIKIFGAFRDEKECNSYIEVIGKVLGAGVNHPKMYKSKQGYLYQMDGARLAVFECVDGKTFYELGRKPNNRETKKIIEEAAKINKIDYRPPFVYDSWAITAIVDQYEIVQKFLSNGENKVIAPLVEKFDKFDLKSLPHAFVHGDITTTNTMLGENGKIYIIDFAVANWYPRIMELAVPMCNLLSEQSYSFVVSEYQKHIKLTELELEMLPLFIDLANAMHVIGAVRERDIYKNGSEENDYWLQQGQRGLGII